MTAIVHAMDVGAKAVADGEGVIVKTGEKMQTAAEQISGVTRRMEDIAGILGQQTEASNEISEGIATIAEMTGENVKQVDAVVDAMSEADAKITTTMDLVMESQIPDATVYRAKSDHVIWKKKLAEMVIGRTSLMPGELADHHKCRLGKWHDNLKDPAVRNHPSYTAIVEPHKAVHTHGIEAARRFNNGDLSGALNEIRLVSHASVDVLRHLDGLIRR
jgi:methyl-accepting chemotaxis protein